LRLIAGEIEALGGTGLRLDRLESLACALRVALKTGRSWRGTLAGMTLALDERGLLTIASEKPRRRGRGTPVASGERVFPQVSSVAGGRPKG
jgi:hypothetical protein